MAQEDKLKISLANEWGIYCYRVMPFRLKNIGATYQRMAATFLQEMVHKEIEVYVDDMNVKSLSKGRSCTYTQKTPHTNRAVLPLTLPEEVYVQSYVREEVELPHESGASKANQNKIKVILDLPEPRNEKQERSFVGKL